MRATTFTCWARTGAYEGRCPDCKRKVLYRINRATGHSIRFNGVLDPVHTFIEDANQQPMEVRSIDDLHVRSCPKRKPNHAAAAGARA